MTSKNNSSQQGDKNLVESAKRFLESFLATALHQGDWSKIPPTSGISLGEGGAVELTEQVTDALGDFVHRAAKLLGSAAAHESAIAQTAMKEAQSSLANGISLDVAAKTLIAAVFDQGNVAYEYLAPNKLMRLHPGVETITIGRVRVMRTRNFNNQRAALYPDANVKIVPGEGFSLQFSGTNVLITMHPVSWIVKVDSILENVEEEGKWLIDVAISLLRLRHNSWNGYFPTTGKKEPHPTRGSVFEKDGVKFQGARVLAGGSAVPPWYEIDSDVVGTISEKDFIDKAECIFAPPKKSLAERVGQGLGWLTRGRQAEDRAERLLYFFTAIEALLSNDDKTAPVTQTIARHGAVLLTDENAERFGIAAHIKSLYNSRSALVHAGNRSILWSSANSAQQLAEAMFQVVLEKADIKIAHAKFCDGLARASYGLPWKNNQTPAVDEIKV